jgi:hypothetical protein
MYTNIFHYVPKIYPILDFWFENIHSIWQPCSLHGFHGVEWSPDFFFTLKFAFESWTCNKKRRGNGDDENGSVFFAKRQKSKRMKVSFPKFQK